MHRSGTSLVTRLVNLLGTSLGSPERLMKANADNPKGYWEHTGFVEINDQILARFGGSYSEPPTFPSGWETSPELQDLRESAYRLITQEFADSLNWGWKDPRTCLTLPFWQQLIPVMRYVICLRNPADVAQSLHERDHFDFTRSSRLWLRYVSAILRGTAAFQRRFVFYEDLMLDWSSQLDALSSFLNGSSAVVTDEVRRQSAAFVDGELHHHATPLLQNLSHPQVAFEAKALYLLLRLRGPEDGKTDPPRLPDRLHEVFAQQASGSAERAKQLEARCQQFEAQWSQLKVEYQSLDAHRQKVEQQLLSEQGRAQELVTARQQLEERLADELKKLSEAKDAHQTERVKLAGERDKAQVMVEEQRARLQGIENSLAWRLIGRMRATKDSLIPHGTQRRRIYDVGLNIVKNRWHSLG